MMYVIVALVLTVAVLAAAGLGDAIHLRRLRNRPPQPCMELSHDGQVRCLLPARHPGPHWTPGPTPAADRYWARSPRDLAPGPRP